MSKTRCPIIQTDYGLVGHPVVICSILHLLWIEKLLNTPRYIGQFPAVAAAVASLANSSLVYVSFWPVSSAPTWWLGWAGADPSMFGLVTAPPRQVSSGTLSCHASSAGAGVSCCLLSVSVCRLSAVRTVCCQDCLGHAFTASLPLWI